MVKRKAYIMPAEPPTASLYLQMPSLSPQWLSVIRAVPIRTLVPMSDFFSVYRPITDADYRCCSGNHPMIIVSMPEGVVHMTGQ